MPSKVGLDLVLHGKQHMWFINGFFVRILFSVAKGWRVFDTRMQRSKEHRCIPGFNPPVLCGFTKIVAGITTRATPE